MTILLRQKPLPQVVRQIVQRDNGAWFDPEDMSTMFQDAAGTIPVTALEQPVGKWLDKSGNGNHATQSVTASRPVISARKNLLTKTEDFADEVWVKYLMVSVANNVFIPSTVYGAHYIAAPTNINYVAGVKYTLSARVKSKELTKIGLFFSMGPFDANGRHAWFDIATGIVGGYQSGVAASISEHPSGGFLCSITCTAVSTLTGFCGIYNTEGGFGDTIVGDGVSGVYVYYSQLEYGPTATTYQKVNTATDYDTAGFPKYIKADGVDDHFVLPYLGLYNNASCSIIASHSSSSQAANGVIVSEASSTDADTKYLPYRQLASAGNVDSYIAADNAAVILDSTGAAYSGTKENIIESIIDSGTSIKTYRSGVLLSNEPYTRSATLTLNNTTLFGSVSTTNTNFLNTKLYGLIITKSNLSARDRSLCETYLKSKVQVLQV